MNLDIVFGLISSIIGGGIVAFVNYWFSRRKIDAETEKLRAEADKFRAETAKLISESTDQANYFKTSDMSEIFVYDGRKGITDFDFNSGGEIINETTDKIIAKGSVSIQKGAIILDRKNKEGRYLINFHRYFYDGKEHDAIPKNPLLPGERKLKIKCEAKVTSGSHTLWFIIKDNKSGDYLAQSSKIIDQNKWTPIALGFTIKSTEACWLRIDDRDITKIESSLHIKNLVISEIN